MALYITVNPTIAVPSFISDSPSMNKLKNGDAPETERMIGTHVSRFLSTLANDETNEPLDKSQLKMGN